ncbi:hypothetical protein ABE61_17330 [Lysinibacillus sphaericus]|uniref:hypothetical protein n=1 Tax=Lysinibacillus sphaericus TaxID=1421 RepID=UPI0018CE221F|nr:hypothetical protein [Lysinibacillus sphaericus]MBG9455832.1 hypothetical protein [Lysinibacillus sphaericus]MBG9477851.1 hypothetical protein [Lysinibacillus sphaericus]MBG9593310.1 hypothetical protein [Lysinibacillus sphaericus]
MNKPIKKSWMIASALTIGMAVLTPLQAGATSVEPTTNGVTVQIEQQITGKIKEISEDGVYLKGRDGKNYYINLYKFSEEQREKMNLVEVQEVTVEGNVVEGYSDFYTFDVYKKELPKGVTNEDLTKLEKMFKEAKKLEKEAAKADENKAIEEAEKKYEELHKIYVNMGKIVKPYYLANWQPEPFEQYIEDYGFSEKNIVIEENDKKHLKVIYEEWVKLEKDNQEEKANEKMKEFQKKLQPYFDKLYPTPTFEAYIKKFELDIPAEDLAKLKNIYDNAQKAEKDDNGDLSVKLWEEFYYIIDKFIKPPTFDDYMADYDFKVSKADSKQLKQLYEEILKLDLKEEKVKIEEKWEAFHTILEPYFKANKEILISASKLIINGQEYLPQ